MMVLLYIEEMGHDVNQGGPAQYSNLYQKRFKQSGFDSVLIQEHHKKWTQREAYTIGLLDPGGPDFYINMRDNADDLHHGSLDGGEQDNPVRPFCFGKIISGFDLADYIHKLPVQPGPVAIVSMRLL